MLLKTFLHPDVVPFAQILLDGLPVKLPIRLTPSELAYCVTLLGKGVPLEQAIDRIQAQRPTLPFQDPPEAA
jgi:hypothetical protein